MRPVPRQRHVQARVAVRRAALRPRECVVDAARGVHVTRVGAGSRAGHERVERDEIEPLPVRRQATSAEVLRGALPRIRRDKLGGAPGPTGERGEVIVGLGVGVAREPLDSGEGHRRRIGGEIEYIAAAIDRRCGADPVSCNEPRNSARLLVGVVGGVGVIDCQNARGVEEEPAPVARKATSARRYVPVVRRAGRHELGRPSVDLAIDVGVGVGVLRHQRRVRVPVDDRPVVTAGSEAAVAGPGRDQPDDAARLHVEIRIGVRVAGGQLLGSREEHPGPIPRESDTCRSFDVAPVIGRIALTRILRGASGLERQELRHAVVRDCGRHEPQIRPEHERAQAPPARPGGDCLHGAAHVRGLTGRHAGVNPRRSGCAHGESPTLSHRAIPRRSLSPWAPCRRRTLSEKASDD